jgi:DNA polymerase I-like protein with 3'-5' exonuclease and polymerase domains
MTLPGLAPRHYDLLHTGSGLTDALIQERGYRTSTGLPELRQHGIALPPGCDGTGLLLPMHTVQGGPATWHAAKDPQPVPLVQYRPDHPAVTSQGKLAKYLYPKGAPLRLDCHPRVQPLLADPSHTLWVTEGLRKEDCLVTHGLCAIGLQGVTCWRGKNLFGGIKALSDWHDIALNREIVIAFDSDVMQKPQVARALQSLEAWLTESRHAQVTVVYLPSPTGAKVGVDDYLLTHTLHDLEALRQPLKACPSGPGAPPELDDDEPAPDPCTAARWVEARLRDEMRYDTAQLRWRRYGEESPGIWGLVEAEAANMHLLDALGACGISSMAWPYFTGVRSFAHGLLRESFAGHQRHLLPLQNGVLDAQTNTFRPYRPDDRFTWCLPFDHVPHAQPTKTLEVLREMVNGSDQVVGLLRAFLRAAVLGRTEFHKLLELLGPGGTGKSTLIHLAQALLGLKNCGTTSLKRLETNRFELIDLVPKRLVVITDSERYTGSVATLKAWVGQDTLPLERKYAKVQGQGVAEGLIMIAANEPIQSNDYTSGLERRRLTVYFRHKPEHERRLIEPAGDTFIGELVPELPALLSWVLAMPEANMERLLRHPRTHVAAVQQEFLDTLLANNPLADWADHALIHAPGKKTYVGVATRIRDPREPKSYLEQHTWLYPNYCAFAESIKALPVGKDRFSRLLEDLLRYQLGLAGVYRKRDNQGAYIDGVVLRTEDDSQTPPLFSPGLDDPSPPPGGGPGPRPPVDDPPEEPSDDEPTFVGAAARARDDGDGALKDRHPISPSNGAASDGSDGSDGVFKSLLGKEKSATHHGAPTPFPSSLLPSAIEQGGKPSPSSPPSLASNGAAKPSDGPTPDRHHRHLHTPEGVPFTYITTEEQLAAVLPTLLASPTLGLDTETTGLHWRRDRLRLIQLATPAQVAVIDAFVCPLERLRPLFEGTTTFIAHHAKFDLHFLGTAGLPWPTHLRDTMILAQLLGARGGERQPSYRLQHVVERTLGLTLDKTEQQSGWGAPHLSEEQLVYAARDAAILLPLETALTEAITTAGLTRIAKIEMACLPAVVWTQEAGMPLDETAWRALASDALAHLTAIETDLQALVDASGYVKPIKVTKTGKTPKNHDPLMNWNSWHQVVPWLQHLGFAVEWVNKEVLAMLHTDAPAVALLQERYTWVEGTKRGTWVDHFCDDGRVYAEFRQMGSSAGRMSCAEPNLQSIPRSKDYRRCIRAPEGYGLLKADYGQIELRIAAVLANETQMLAAFRDGKDLHRLTAARVRGIDPSAVTDEERHVAKTVNFGLIYGLGAAALRTKVWTEARIEISLAEAEAFRRAFFQMYPAFVRWHGDMKRQIRREGGIDTRTLTGRRRLDVREYTETANTPTQGTAADGFKVALARLWRDRQSCPTARIIGVFHDEILVEVPQDDAAVAKAWLQQHMEAAMTHIVKGKVPIVANVQLWQDWAGTPLEKDN